MPNNLLREDEEEGIPGKGKGKEGRRER